MKKSWLVVVGLLVLPGVAVWQTGEVVRLWIAGWMVLVSVVAAGADRRGVAGRRGLVGVPVRLLRAVAEQGGRGAGEGGADVAEALRRPALGVGERLVGAAGGVGSRDDEHAEVLEQEAGVGDATQAAEAAG